MRSATNRPRQAKLAMSMIVSNAVRGRLELTKPLNDRCVLQLSLAASCTDAHELIGYMFNQSLALEVCACKEAPLTEHEWAALFVGVRPASTKVSADVATSAEFAESKIKMEKALEHTLLEHDQKRTWNQPLSQLLVFVALHCREGADARLQRVLGAVVRTDSRRIEDLRSELSSASNTMLLGKAIEAIVFSVNSI